MGQSIHWHQPQAFHKDINLGPVNLFTNHFIWKGLFAFHYNSIDQHVVILLINMLLNFYKPLKSSTLK